MAYHDVWELTDKQDFMGQEVNNVYFYQNTDPTTPPASASDLVTEWIENVLPSLLEIQGDNLTHISVSARNLFDDTDKHVESISYAGHVTGDLMPTFNAFGFELVQGNGAVKNGAKRFAGVAEGAATDGIVTDSATISALNDVSDVLTEVLNVGLANVFTPVVIGRILSGDVYALPDAFADAVIGIILEAGWKTVVTSQTSRKIGVGA